MLESKIPEIDLNTLMARVRAEVARLGEETPPVDDAADPDPAPSTLDQAMNGPSRATDGWCAMAAAEAHDQDLSCTAPRAVIHYRDLDAYFGPRFVHQAYGAVLGRPPDAESLVRFAAALLSGRLTKPEVVFHLRRSAEGRAFGVKVRGLLPALAGTLWRKIPGIGKILRRLDALEHAVAGRASLDRLEARLREVVHPRLDALSGALSGLERSVASLREELQRLLTKDPLAHLHQHAQAIAGLREALADLRGQLGAEWHCRQPVGSTPSAPPEPQPNVGARATESFHTALEDAFRGAPDKIYERLRFYLPYVLRMPLDFAPLPVVDAGCGRGEWLDLLRSEGVNAIGVDLNALMVSRCLERGLSAVEADAVQYLLSKVPGRVGVVTAFQFIEHLSLDDLIRFLDAAYRALVPGGMVLLETPNPENLMVSCYSFYMDPTHRHPIPPPLAVFLLESVGFCDVAVVRPPRAGESSEHDAEENLPPLLHKLLFSPEDYAVIAHKAPCRENI